MKKLIASLTLVVLFAIAACSGAQRQEEKNVLTWVQTQCLMMNPAMEPPALVVACGIDIALTPYVEQFLSAYRKQLADARAAGSKESLASCAPPPAPAPPAPPPLASAPPPAPPPPPPAPSASAPPAAPKKGKR